MTAALLMIVIVGLCVVAVACLIFVGGLVVHFVGGRDNGSR